MNVNERRLGGAEGSKSNNRADGPLSVDPEQATFLEKAGKSEHLLVNLSKQRMAVKVRCSDNRLFRVNPVFTIIEPGQCRSLTITRIASPSKVDKLILQYVFCTEADQDPKEVFKNIKYKPDNIKMPLVCISQEDAPAVGPTTPPVEKML